MVRYQDESNELLIEVMDVGEVCSWYFPTLLLSTEKCSLGFWGCESAVIKQN